MFVQSPMYLTRAKTSRSASRAAETLFSAMTCQIDWKKISAWVAKYSPNLN